MVVVATAGEQAALGDGVGLPAFVVLLVALAHPARELARIGGVGTGVVLDVTAAPESGCCAHESVAVDGEGAISSAANNGGRWASESPGKGLDIGSWFEGRRYVSSDLSYQG